MDKPALLTGSKRDLALLLKRRGSVTLDEAEEATGLSRTTLREHFGRLERDGLVKRSTIREGRGRPRLSYSLSAGGERLFPSQDHQLLGSLLRFLQEAGEDELIDRFFRSFWKDRLADARHALGRIESTDSEARLAAIEQLLRDQGFMPEIRRTDNKLVIRECNCPFPEAVRRTRLPCVLEAEFFESILNREAGRVAYIPDGSPACTYEFSQSDD